MANALIFLAPGYEEVEMLTVVDMLRRAGISIDMVSICEDLEVISSHNVSIKADRLFYDANFEETQMLILPGGMPGTTNLLAYTPLCDQLRAYADDPQKMLAAVCAAPTVLSSLGILAGKKATCYPTFVDKLTDATYLKQPVVVEGNIITSRGMGTCIEFAGAIIEKLTDRKTADDVKAKIIYNDQY